PTWVVATELVEVADPPAVVSDTRLGRELPVQITSCDLLAKRDRFEHRAVGVPAPAHVVDGCDARLRMKRGGRAHEVGAVQIVAHLLPAVPLYDVALARDRAAHQV